MSFRVSWVGEAGQGFSLEYPHVAMHAVQLAGADATFVHGSCLYLVIDVRLVDSDETPTPSSSTRGSDAEDEERGGGDDDDAGITEIRFVPEDSAKLQSMFDAMTACQALHPDPADISEEEEDDEEEGEDDGAGGDQPQEEGMFDDAEEEAEGGHNGQGDQQRGEEEPMEEDGAAANA